MATNKQTPKEDQVQRDKINRMDFTITEVILPALTTIKDDVKKIADKDYVTSAEAENKFVSMAVFKALEDKVKSIQKWGTTIITLLLAGLVSMFYALLQRNIK